MTPGFAALTGAMMVGGLFVLILGLVSPPDAESVRPLRGRRASWWRRASTSTRRRLAAGLAVGVGAYAYTGWPLMVVLGPLAVWGLPVLLADPPRREIELLEALDRWVQVLIGSMATGKSIPDAVRATRSQVPDRLAEPVARLISRIEVRWPVGQAFLALSHELASPEADSVIAALILSARRGGQGATAALKALSLSIRARLAALREVESERSKPRVVVRQVTGISAAVLGGGLVLGRQFFEPYGTPIGQLILTTLIGIYVGALFALRRMTQSRPRERLLGATSMTEASHA